MGKRKPQRKLSASTSSAKPEDSAKTSADLRQQSIALLLEIMDLQAAPNPELAAKQRRLLEALRRRAENPPSAP